MILYYQICETTECERVQHIKELFIKYSEMLEGVIPQMQQVYTDENWLIDLTSEVNKSVFLVALCVCI